MAAKTTASTYPIFRSFIFLPKLVWGILLFICFLLPFGLQAQEAEKEKERRIGVLPVPSFGYAPETRWYVGAVALFTLNFYSDSLTRTSNAKTEVNFTQNKQLVISAGWNWFSQRDRYYFTGDNSYNKFPEDFFGIGNKTHDSLKENYDSRRIEIELSLLKQVRPGWFIGPRYQLQHMYNITPLAGGLLQTREIMGSKGGTSSGLGFTIAFDKRDNLLNPTKAGYAAVSQTFFHDVFGSDFGFNRTEVDLRRYFKGFANHILALQANGTFHSGNPPFRMMALLGSDADMRGYYRGRFRDRNYAAFQAEYRATLIGRFGATVFGGFGQVAHRLNDFGFKELKPTYGTGLRFLIDRKENVNLRFDFAWGKNSSGFYVAFGEAF